MNAAIAILQEIGIKPAARIAHLKDDAAFLLRQGNTRYLCAGMLKNIRQRFLENAKQRGVDVAGNSHTRLVQIHLDENAAALHEAFHVPAERGYQAELVEQRG